MRTNSQFIQSTQNLNVSIPVMRISLQNVSRNTAHATRASAGHASASMRPATLAAVPPRRCDAVGKMPAMVGHDPSP